LEDFRGLIFELCRSVLFYETIGVYKFLGIKGTHDGMKYLTQKTKLEWFRELKEKRSNFLKNFRESIVAIFLGKYKKINKFPLNQTLICK